MQLINTNDHSSIYTFTVTTKLQWEMRNVNAYCSHRRCSLRWRGGLDRQCYSLLFSLHHPTPAFIVFSLISCSSFSPAYLGLAGIVVDRWLCPWVWIPFGCLDGFQEQEAAYICRPISPMSCLLCLRSLYRSFVKKSVTYYTASGCIPKQMYPLRFIAPLSIHNESLYPGLNGSMTSVVQRASQSTVLRQHVVRKSHWLTENTIWATHSAGTGDQVVCKWQKTPFFSGKRPSEADVLLRWSCWEVWCHPLILALGKRVYGPYQRKSVWKKEERGGRERQGKEMKVQHIDWIVLTRVPLVDMVPAVVDELHLLKHCWMVANSFLYWTVMP